MSKAMKLGLVFVAFILMIGISAGVTVVHNSLNQMTPEEKKAEMLSYLTPEDLVNKLSDSKDFVNLLVKVLGPETVIRILSGKNYNNYDYDYNLVGLAGSDPASLTDSQRAILVEAFNSAGRRVAFNIGLGWVYEDKYVVAPIQCFYKIDAFGATPLWNQSGITLKAYLLPDSNKEDNWKKEELGKIHFPEERGLPLVVIERADPIIDVQSPRYKIGKYEDLSIDNVLYQITQINGRIGVKRTSVSGFLADDKGWNLFIGSGELLRNELGGLAFAIRDGKFELVGFLAPMEPVIGEQNLVYVHFLDIQQIIDYIEKEIKTK
jgi:hypothetical protein